MFIVAPIALLAPSRAVLDAYVHHDVVIKLVASLGAVILSFIGGMVHHSAVTREDSLWVANSIVTALGAWVACASAEVVGAANGLALIALCFLVQLGVEHVSPWWHARDAAALLRSSRAAPLLVASTSLAWAAEIERVQGESCTERVAFTTIVCGGITVVAAWRLSRHIAVAACGSGVPNAPMRRFDLVEVGSTNPCKLGAVARVLETHASLASPAAIVGHSVPSGVSDQPMGLHTTVDGAYNRAEAALLKGLGAPGESGDVPTARRLFVGIESGLFRLRAQNGASPHLDVCVVCVLSVAADGKYRSSYGLSCAFPIPPALMRHVIDGGMELSEACVASGITDDAQVGERGGLIGILTDGRVTRGDYTEQAMEMALINFENDEWYL